MALDPSIILRGESPNVMGAMSQGIATAQQARQAQSRNALQDLYKTQGAGIIAGDQGSLNALASMDPMAAMNVQAQRQSMDAQRQSMGLQAEQAKRAAAEYARGISAEQRQSEAQQLEKALSGASYFYSTGDKAGYANFLQQNGVDPNQFPFEAFPAHAATMGGVLEVLKGFTPEPADPLKGAPSGYMFNTPGKPGDGVTPIPGMIDKATAPYTPEGKLKADLDAGRIGQAEYEAGLARLSPKGTSLMVDPTTGVVTFTQGGASGTGTPTVGQVYNPNEVASVVKMIDEIGKDPSLARVVGPVVGGGGNNIDDLNVAQRMYYGGEGTALVERIGQLQSNAWLSARAMLKGGGAITDYESKKAEAAVARLSRAKGETEFRTALKDLRDAITEGEAKLKAAGQGGAAPTQAAPTADFNTMPMQDLLSVPLESLSIDQLRAYNEALKRGGQ